MGEDRGSRWEGEARGRWGWAFVTPSIEEWCVFSVKEEKWEGGLERVLLLRGARELMSSSVVCCVCAI